jgi:hypothetical protein
VILICQPERFGLPAVPSRKGRCGRCAATVWVSKREVREEIDTYLCVVCAMSVVKPGDTISEASWVAADLAELEAE